MKYLILLCVLFTMPVMACDINTYGLSDVDAQELKVLCEQKKAAAIKAGNTTGSSVAEAVNKIDEDTIAKIGAISDAIVSAVTGIARGLGVEVNEFIKTPAGMLVAGILVFYLVGSKLLGIMLMILIAIFSRTLITRTRNIFSTGNVTVKEIPIFGGWYTRVVKTTEYIPFKDWTETQRDTYVNMCTTMAIVNILSVVIIVSIMVTN